DLVRLPLVGAAEGQEHADGRAHAEGRGEELAHLRGAILQGDVEGYPAELRCHHLTHALVAVFGDGVRDLVPHHDRERVLVPRNGQQSSIHHDLAARQAERVHLVALDDVELPLVALEPPRIALPLQRHLRGQSDALTDAPHLSRQALVVRELALFEDVLVLAPAQLLDLRLREQLEAPTPREGGGGATDRQPSAEDPLAAERPGRGPSGLAAVPSAPRRRRSRVVPGRRLLGSGHSVLRWLGAGLSTGAATDRSAW